MKVAYIQESTPGYLNSQGLTLLQNADILSTLDVNEMISFIETEFQKGVRKFVLNIGTFRLQPIIPYIQARTKFDCALFVCTFSTADNVRLIAPPNFVFSITANKVYLKRGMDLISAGAGALMITVVSGSGTFVSEVESEGSNYGSVYRLPADGPALTARLNVPFPNNVLTIALAISPDGDIDGFVNILNNTSFTPPLPIFSFDYIPDIPKISTTTPPYFVISANVSDTLNFETAPAYLKSDGGFIPPNNATSVVLVNSPEYWCDYIKNNTLARGFCNYGVTFNRIIKQV